MQEPEKIDNLLKQYNKQALKKLGQHFLISKKVLGKIVNAIKTRKGEETIEVGPGTGILTAKLLKSKSNVTAIEIDSKLISILKEKFKNEKHLEIVHFDILDYLDSDDYKKKNHYKIVGNIPYQITSPLIRKILAQKKLPKLIVFMVQKEMAERITATAGDSKRGYLSVLVQLFGNPEIVDFVSKNDFYPVPKVDSAILKIIIKPLSLNINQEKLLRLVKCGFSQKRKKLRNSLSAGLHLQPDKMELILSKANINPNLRAEDLSIKEWEKITLVVD